MVQSAPAFLPSRFMGSLRAFVTQDNGALHVACSTDVPVVALFGPSEPVHTGPYPLRPRHTVIKRGRIEQIQPTEVCSAVLKAIDALRSDVPRRLT